MPIYQIRLTTQGARETFNPHQTHGVLSRAFNREPHQWAKVKQNLLICRANRPPENNPRLFQEITRYEEHPITGTKIQIATIIHPIIRKGSKETPLLQPEEQEAWVKTKTQDALQIEQITIEHLPPRKVFRHGKKYLLTASAIHAIGTITDQQKFIELLDRGIGRCKAHGFGLITYKECP